MVNRPDPTDAAAADPWLKAALQRPAGPSADAAGPGSDLPSASSGVDAGAGASAAAPEGERAAGGGEGASPSAGLVEPAEVAEAADGGEVHADLHTDPHTGLRVDPQLVRRLAVQALYVLDGEPETSEATLLEALDEPFDDEDEPDAPGAMPDAAKEAAVGLASAAWRNHKAADAAIVARAPSWPTSRQPPVDRAILRLAHHELSTQRAPFAVVIDQAVELAHAFGEERTAGFVNAVLDGLAREQPAPEGVHAAGGDAGEVRRATGPRPAAGAAEARRGQRRRFNVRKAEMAAKIGPKRPRDEVAAEPEERAEASPEAPLETARGPAGESPAEASQASTAEPLKPAQTFKPAADSSPAPSAKPPSSEPAAESSSDAAPALDPWAAAAARRPSGEADAPSD